MLTDEEKQRLMLEEKCRFDIQRELEKQEKDKQPPRSLLANSNFRWLVSVILIPVLGVAWGVFQKHLADREATLREDLARRERERQEKLANSQRSAELLIALLPHLAATDSGRHRMALAILRNLGSQKVTPPEVESSLVAIVEELERQSLTPMGGEEAREKLEVLAGSQERLGRVESAPDGPRAGLNSGSEGPPPPSTAAPPVAEADTGAQTALRFSLPRVYLQIYEEASRDKAEELRRNLRKEKFLAPGVENVVATAGRKGQRPPRKFPTTQVLYFHEADEESAHRVSSVLRTQEPALEVKVEKRSVPQAPSGLVEVWLVL